MITFNFELKLFLTSSASFLKLEAIARWVEIALTSQTYSLLGNTMVLLPTFSSPVANGDRFGQARIRIQIPSHYQKEPIISQLASQYHLEVNILAAILGANAQGSGWFDLQLTGQPDNLNQGLAYLQQLGVEILATSEPANENW